MTRTNTRLLAAVIASGALLGATSAPASAAGVIEASAALWAYQQGDQHESFAVEVSPDPQRVDYVKLDRASGRTAAHPGWDLRFSDESVGGNLPQQNVELKARSGADGSSGSASSFLSIVDKTTADQPFLLIKSGDGIQCSSISGSVSPYTLGDTAFYYRDAGGALVAFTPSAGPVVVTGVARGDRADGATAGHTSVKVNRIDSTRQITSYGPFAKFANGSLTGATGLEIVITQSDQANDPNPVTHRLLLNTTAVSC